MPNHQMRRHRRFVARQAKLQWNRCCYCRVTMTPAKFVDGKKCPDNMATKDHVIPKCFGGGNVMTNFVVCCYKCNGERSDLPADLFAIFKVWQRKGKPEL